MCGDCEARLSQHCPCEPAPAEAPKCDTCGDNAVSGDECVYANGNFYHVDCLSEMGTSELLEALGYQPFTYPQCPDADHDTEVDGI